MVGLVSLRMVEQVINVFVQLDTKEAIARVSMNLNRIMIRCSCNKLKLSPQCYVDSSLDFYVDFSRTFSCFLWFSSLSRGYLR